MKTAIVTGGTKKDIDAMAVLAINIQKVSPNLADELVIYHDGISLEKQKLIQEIMPTRFIRYKCPLNLFKLMSNKVIRYFSPMIFCKYECLKLLNEYDTVIWTDYDVVIKEDISELKYCNMDMNFILDKETPLKKMFFEGIEKADMGEYDLMGDCITAPLFVFKNSLPKYNEYYDWCYDMTDKYLKYLYLPEQCIYTMLVQNFHIPYGELDKETYYYHPKIATEKTKILHAYGQPKFWNGLYNEQWDLCYKEWMNMNKREKG